MVSSELGQQLHGRAVRREVLSAEEHARLEAWYAEMDRAEAARLNANATVKAIATEESLQAEIDSALAQLADTIKRIQEIAAENATLRRENAALLRQFAQRSMLQPV